MKKQEPVKGKGCLKALGVIGVLIGALIIYVITTLPSQKTIEPLETFFLDNNMGEISGIISTEKGNMLKLDFEANGIEYTAYIVGKEFDNHKVGDILTISSEIMPIYSLEDNDLIFDDTEKAILINRANYLKLTSGYTNVIPEILRINLESKINYPETLEIGDVTTYDKGDCFIQKIEFWSKNAFGTRIRNFAKYKVDFKTNEIKLQAIY